MPKYVITSIPLAAALVVGLIAYSISMGLSGAPSEGEIRRAPTWSPRSNPRRKQRRSSGLRPDFSKIKRLASGNLDDLDVGDAEAEPKRTTRPKRRTRTRRTASSTRKVEVYCKQTLRSKRQKAQRSARNAGLAFGAITLALGYLSVFHYLKSFSKKSAAPAWQQVLAAQQQAAPEAAQPTQNETPTQNWDDTPTETEYQQTAEFEQPVEDEELPPDTDEVIQ